MKFVRITGETLTRLTEPEQAQELRAAGVTDSSQVRINQQGDIEVLNNGSWNVIGGLLGDYESRIRRVTGLEWS